MFQVSTNLKQGFWQGLTEKLVFLMPLFFPLYLVKVNFGPIPTNVLEIIIGLTVLFWIIAKIWKCLKEGCFFNYKMWLAENTGLIFWGILLLFILSYSINVPSQYLLRDGSTVFEAKRIALGILKGWIILPLIYFLFLKTFTKQRVQLKTSLYAYLISVLPLAVWGFWQFISGHFITPDARVSGPFINANYLAMYMSPAVVLCWIFLIRAILEKANLKKFLIWTICALFLSFVLLTTQSYGAIIAVFIGMVIYLVCSLKIFKKYEMDRERLLSKKIIFLLAVLGFCVILAASALFINTKKWQVFTDVASRSSTAVRVQVYDVAFGLIERNPFFGIGLGQFKGQYDLHAAQILGRQPYELVMLHPHNTFLTFWLYLGFPGLLLFLYLIYIVYSSYLRSEDFDMKYFRLIGITLFTVMLLHGMVDTYFFKNDLAMLFWLILAISVLPRKEIETKIIKI